MVAMQTRSTITLPGSGVQVLGPVDGLDYYHRSAIELPAPMSAVEAWSRLMEQPVPGMKLAFRIRDAIAARFGVKRLGALRNERQTTPKPGDKLDFFLVEHVSEQILTLTERDRHLDVMTCVSTEGQALSITSSVVTHNLFGRLYMIPVGIGHKLIVNTMLRRMKRTLGSASGVADAAGR